MDEETQSNVTSLFETDTGLSYEERSAANRDFENAQIDPNVRASVTKLKENLARLQTEIVGVGFIVVTKEMSDALSIYSDGLYDSDKGLAMTIGHIRMLENMLIDQATADRMSKTTEDD